MWVIYALLCAFFAATTDPIAKIALKDSDEYLVGWLTLLLSTPFLAFFYFGHNVDIFNPGLARTLITVIPFEILGSIFYYKALKMTDISLSVPFLALTPLFTVLTAFILIGETVRPAGMLGIVLISAGVYSLNFDKIKFGFTHPIKAIFENRGSVYMVGVALVFGVTSTMSKMAMLCSSPETIPFIYNMSISLVMLPIIVYRLKKGYSVLNKNYKIIVCYIALGFFAALSSIFYFKSVAMANVAYAISIKRLSLLVSIGYGWLFFRERDVHIRFFSTSCMFLGIVLILIG